MSLFAVTVEFAFTFVINVGRLTRLGDQLGAVADNRFRVCPDWSFAIDLRRAFSAVRRAARAAF